MNLGQPTAKPEWPWLPVRSLPPRAASTPPPRLSPTSGPLAIPKRNQDRHRQQISQSVQKSYTRDPATPSSPLEGSPSIVRRASLPNAPELSCRAARRDCPKLSWCPAPKLALLRFSARLSAVRNPPCFGAAA